MKQPSAQHHQHWTESLPLSLVSVFFSLNLWLQAENDNLSMRWLFLHVTTRSFKFGERWSRAAMLMTCPLARACSPLVEMEAGRAEQIIWRLKFKQTQPEISRNG